MVSSRGPDTQLGSTPHFARSVSATSKTSCFQSADLCSLIQQVFHDYLRHLVNTAQDNFRITLHTAISEISEQNIDYTRPSRGGAVEHLEIRVLTPAFYSRFVHYAYTAEAFDRECIFTDEKNRTCWVSRPELLAKLLTQSASIASQSIVQRGRFNEAKWALLRRLRCAPAEPTYHATPKSTEFCLEDIRAARYSEIDNFVRRQRESSSAGMYRRIVTKVFLAQRFCLGFSQVVTLMDWILRFSLCYLAARQVSKPSAFGSNALLEQDWWPITASIAAATASHTYGLLKGYR